ncbi:MAG: ABC transporter substrate-binding protein [Pseudobdellovibrionaceae bacterium]|nr:ABC transporter substrate-binding protein [Pseudobdellovibrionaceae bacterium]
MNKTVYKYFMATGLLILSFGLGWLARPATKFVSEQPVLRMFTRYQIDFKKLEPAAYQTADEYNYVSYLYSPLVEFNNQGQLVGGLAEKFYWKGNELVFEIRKGTTSSKGDPITAEDVVLSFKRFHILNPNKAIHLFSDVCKGNKLTKLTDPCEGLSGKGNKFSIHFSKQMPLYVDLISNLDFAVVPRNSIDPITLKVIDPDNVTGPYAYTERNEQLSLFRLEARQNHWHYSKKIPQKVLIKTFVDIHGGAASFTVAATAMGNNEFDLWPTFGGAAAVAALIPKNPTYSSKYNFFLNAPNAVYTVFFSDRAKRDFSVEERLHIAELIRSGYYADDKRYSSDIVAKTNQIFPFSSDGSLTVDQQRIYSEALSRASRVPLKRVPVLHVVKSYMGGVMEKIDSTGGKISYLAGEDYEFPPSTEYQNKFDGFFTTINLSSIESLDSIFWLRSANWMPYSSQKNDEWIDRYLKEEDKSNRVELMRQLHLDMLLQSNVAPIEAASHGAVVRKPWKFNFSKLFTNTPLWQIEYED